MVEDEVRVVYTKYDGSLHWHLSMYRLGEDEHGVWLGAPAGTPMRRGHEEPIIAEQDHVMLFRPEVWWTAVFNAAPHRTEIYCDITTPPAWPSPGEVTMVDLDLDVLRRRTGEVKIVDEDEFAEHQRRFGYPAEVIDAARSAAGWLYRAVHAGREPFGGAHLGWLAQLAQSAGVD